MGQEFLRHADAGILHHNLILGGGRAAHLPHRDGDAVPLRGELEGVGQDVVQHLGHTGDVSHDPGVPDFAVDLKALVFPPRLGGEGIRAGPDAVFQVEGLVVQGDFALFQPGHLQDVVHQVQQLPARIGDLVGIVQHLGRLAGVLPQQVQHPQDGVQGGAHVVGHVVEEGQLGFFVPAGDGQGLLQQLALLDFPALFLVHFPEAEHRLVLAQRRVKEDPDVDPPVPAGVPAQEVAAVVPDVLGLEILEAVGGKALAELVGGVPVHQPGHRMDEVGIGALPAQLAPGIGGTLDDLVGVLPEVDPEQTLIGVAQHLDRLVGPLHQGVQPQVVAHRHHKARNPGAHDGKVKGHELGQLGQHPVHRHRDDHLPAVAGVGVVDAPPHPVHPCDKGVVAGQPAFFHRRQNPVDVALDLLLGDIQVGAAIDGAAAGITDEDGGALRGAGVPGLDGQVLGEDVHGHHRVAVGALLGHRHHRAVVDGIGVDVGEHHLPVGLHGFLIPHRRGVVVVRIPLPGVGGDDLAVIDHIGVHLVIHHRLNPQAVLLDPVPQLLLGVPLLVPGVDHVGAVGDQGLIGVEAPLHLQGIALGQVGLGVLVALQQHPPQKEEKHNARHQQHQGGEDVIPQLFQQMQELLPPAALFALHTAVSRPIASAARP